jgi:flagellar basal body rod protein FlgG
MDPLTVSAAGGLRARMEALDMLANNIANSSTAGFKRDGEFYSVFIDAEAQVHNGGSYNMLPVIQKHWTDFSQGTLQPTGNTLDFALSGNGFFALQSPTGTVYTRNGAFSVNRAGELVSSEGHRVLLDNGNPARVQAGVPVEVAPDGYMRQNGAVIGRLRIVEFGPDALVKHADTLFRPADPKDAGKGATAEVHQGKLEQANVGAAESTVRLVALLRQFEALQKAITIGADMNRKAVEEVARVGS